MDPRNPYAPPQAVVTDAGHGAGEQAPPLWNPNAAAMWGLLLTPTFSAILHMKNWQALGDPARAASTKAWAIGTAVFTLVSAGLAMVLPESAALDVLFRFSGLGVLLAWYYGNGKAQVEHVKQRFGDSYPRRSWAVPLSLGFVAVLALMIVVFLLAFAAAMADAPP